MCDPLSIGVISAVGSAVAGGINYSQQQKAMKQAEQDTAMYNAYQQRIRQAEIQRQDELRKKANVERVNTLGEMAPDAQKNAQATEEARLTDAYAEGTTEPNVDSGTVADLLLTGQASGGQSYKDDAAKRISKATRDGRARIAALAKQMSYGDSEMGLGVRNKLALQKGDQNIGLVNNMRQGSLSTFGTEQAVVQPIQRSPVVSPWGGIASTLASIGGSGIGSGLGRV